MAIWLLCYGSDLRGYPDANGGTEVSLGGGHPSSRRHSEMAHATKCANPAKRGIADAE